MPTDSEDVRLVGKTGSDRRTVKMTRLTISEVGPSPAAARYALMRGAGTETHGWPDVHIHSKVYQGSFGCGCCPPRQKRHRSDPKGIARIQILLCIGWGRRRRCRCDDIRGPRKRQCGER